MHLQAITTKYLGPTNFRPSRIKASAYAGSVTIEYDAGLSTNANHARAAADLAAKFGWCGQYASGGNMDGNVYVAIGDVNERKPGNFDGFVSHSSGADFYGNAHK